MGALQFHQPDFARFPCLALAFDALRAGGTAPALLNAANEIAVEAFLERRIGFRDIDRVVRQVMDENPHGAASGIEAVLAQDALRPRRGRTHRRAGCAEETDHDLPHTVLAFLLALGPLIMFHELGHYWVRAPVRREGAALLDRHGPVVWSRRFGPDQTEWAISALPLGGYVKMLDSRDPGTAPTDSKRPGARIHAPERVEAHRHRRRRPGRQLHARDRPHGRLFMAARRSRARACAAMAAEHGRPTRPACAAATRRPPSTARVRSWTELRWEIVRAAMDKRAAELDVRGAGGGSYRACCPEAAIAALDPKATSWARSAWQSGAAPWSTRCCRAAPADRAGLRRATW
jgi:hypothetical protein